MAQRSEYLVPDLTGRRAIVTGGAKGLGAAATSLLARSGAIVVNGAVRPPMRAMAGTSRRGSFDCGQAAFHPRKEAHAAR
jgi:NAD(P)-dependent dehydrogenase (short-subunit alcohol dehydrogenase family)